MTQRDYTDWQEGLGAEAKPEDYSPEKYEYEVWDGERWDSYGKFAAPVWYPEFRYRVRRRQSEPQGSVVVSVAALEELLDLVVERKISPAALRLASLIAEAKA